MSNALNGFYVIVTGQVEGVKIAGSDNLFVQYQYSYGSDWKTRYGLEHGITQIARRNTGSDNQVLLFNYPIEATFSSTNVQGWPQIVFSVYSVTNFMGKHSIKGYGAIHLPVTPGRHVRYVRLYTPISSSLCQRVTAYLTGNQPEFFTPLFIAQGKGREVSRVKSNGAIKIVLNIATKNMMAWGYSIRGERAISNEEHERATEPAGDMAQMNESENTSSLRRRKDGIKFGDSAAERDTAPSVLVSRSADSTSRRSSSGLAAAAESQPLLRSSSHDD